MSGGFERILTCINEAWILVEAEGAILGELGNELAWGCDATEVRVAS